MVNFTLIYMLVGSSGKNSRCKSTAFFSNMQIFQQKNGPKGLFFVLLLPVVHRLIGGREFAREEHVEMKGGDGVARKICLN